MNITLHFPNGMAPLELVELDTKDKLLAYLDNILPHDLCELEITGISLNKVVVDETDDSN